MTDLAFGPEDDISILQSEDDVHSVSPHVIPCFMLTASRQQMPSTSGITSMEALRNAYEELKKKYNDLNLKYQSLLKSVHKNRMSELIPDELPSGSHSLDDKEKILQMSRKDEIEKLHNAILRLNHELSEEKSKNFKLQVQISSYKEMAAPTFEEGPNKKSLIILEDLKKNIDMLERTVELHKAIITKQLPHTMHSHNQPHFGKPDFISQRKQQSEHDELSSLGNKPGHGPIKVAPTAPVPTEKAQNATWLPQSNAKIRTGIVDLKSIRQKQDKQKDKTNKPATFPHLLTTASPSSSTTAATNALTREKDTEDLNNEETFLFNSSFEKSYMSEMLCPICEEPFTDLSKFQEHIFDCKTEPPDRSCPICMKNFDNAAQDEYEKHVHTHFDQPGDDFEIF